MRGLKALTLSLIFMVVAIAEGTAQRYNLTGRVVNSNDEAVAYATVVALSDDSQVTGGATNDMGDYTLAVPAGDYTIRISFLGYKSITHQVSITGETDMGTTILESDDTAIDEVVVTAQLIRREADRFVVDVANSPVAIGKDGEELLKSAPGVWIQDDKISINGSSGSKIYLNDREVKLEDTQLMDYLRSLRADDIQRIEVIPQSGADYDASSSGGIIKITTKRRLDMGLIGSASLGLQGTKGLYRIMPSISLNYNQGKLNAYGRAWAGINGQSYDSSEHTDYTAGTVIDAETELNESSTWAGGNIGVVYDFNDRHSIGGEVQYNYWGQRSTTDTWTDRTLEGITTRTDGDYRGTTDANMATATLNYIYKFDDMGSTLKLIGDYTLSNTPGANDYFDSSYTNITPDILRDSTYRSASLSRYQLATATLAMEKIISPKLTITAGAKYTFNSNLNNGTYEYLEDDIWMFNDAQSYDIGYSENIGAAYITARATLGRVSLVGGLRGEYTWFRAKDNSVKQNYFDLFPNANVSYMLTKDGAYSMVAQYSRTISRPSFWALSPNETKISEYMIQRGNPNLKPSYNNSVSLTAVLKYKYTITLGISIMQNAIQQTTLADANNPEVLIIQTINYPTLNNYFASVNLPFQITRWWSANVNFTALYMGQRIYPDEPIRRNFMCMGNAQMSFTLPKNFFIEVDGSYLHGAQAGNTRLDDMGNMSVTLKKRMLDNKLTLSISAQNIIPLPQTIRIAEDSFSRVMTIMQPWNRLTAKFSISYNFNSGKQFRARSVESGSADDRSRIGSGSGQ